MDAIELSGYEPGALGRIVELQALYYHQYWDLGLYFEAKAASELAAFLSRFDPAHDGAWFAKLNGEIIGGIFIDGSDAEGLGARLRWFIIDPRYQGVGLGNQLMEAAVSFCRQAGFRRVYLTTFAGLAAARHLYEKYGFRLCGEVDGTHLTGKASMVEQVLELILPQPVPDQHS
jgi:GNAT superfamily N-acetyltransferase